MKTSNCATGGGSYLSKNCLHCGAVAARSMMRLPLQSPVSKPTVGSRLSAILLPATRNNQEGEVGFRGVTFVIGVQHHLTLSTDVYGVDPWSRASTGVPLS